MRLFVAVMLPESIKFGAQKIREAMGNAPGVQWVPLENLHITLQFLGEVPFDAEPKIHERLCDLGRRHRPMNLGLQSGGAFPNKFKARVLWASISGDLAALKEFNGEMEEWLRPYFQKQEKRAFSPHVTLARMKNPVMTATDQFCTLIEPFSTPLFKVNEFHLMESKLHPMGSKYTSRRSFELGPNQ